MKNTRLNISIMSFPWLVLVFFLAYAFPSPPTEEWVTPYNGPGNLEDEIEALAVDASGNVYVTGQSKGNGTNWDYATIKYDPSGNELWVARYDGPSNGWDWPTGLVVDASGNAYVTGGGDAGTDGGSHFATIKYDTNGNELWVTRHHAGLNDYGTCIAVDDSGNVYVAGVTAGHYADWKIIKYDQDGNELWAEHIYLGLYSDVPSAIVVDSSGNVSVTGSRCCADMYTVKYDTNGNEIWHAQYSGTVGQAADGATDLALDSSGDIYVTGWIFNTAGDSDITTIKYNPYGNQIWVALYNGPGHGHNKANSVALDGSGNVLVTGRDAGSDNVQDIVTIKYDPSGNELWVARYDGGGSAMPQDEGKALALDAAGNVYVTGWSFNIAGNSDITTIKYDPDGNEFWTMLYNGTADQNDLGSAIAVDGSNNVYVGGNAQLVSGNPDYVTIKYSQETLPWPTAPPAEASSVYRHRTAQRWNILNILGGLLLIPVGAIIFLRIRRRRR